MKYNFLKFLNTDKAVLHKEGKFYVASFADVPYTGTEVLVFPSNRDGDISEMIKVDGGRGYTNLSEFITENCTVLNTGS